MASPEIKLPATSSEVSDGEHTATGQNYGNLTLQYTEAVEEKEIALSLPPVQEGEPVIYHYLTFETELPPPSDPGPCRDGSAAPEPPDLRNYVSPFTWSESRKTFMTWLSCAVTAVTAYTAGSYSPASQQLSEYWHVSQVATLVGITTFTTGFAIAPMVLAPFSELNGRKPVFIATGTLFVICQLCCAVTRSFPGMLMARFFAGVGGSTFSTMVGGVVSDMYHTQGREVLALFKQPHMTDASLDRNTPMALFSGAALFGTGLGPLVSGFIAQNLSWRWVFYVQTIDCGLLILAVAFFFRETRGSVLLSRRANLLNKWYEAREKAGLVGIDMLVEDASKKLSQRIRWKVKSDEERESLAKMIGISVYRPFRGFESLRNTEELLR